MDVNPRSQNTDSRVSRQIQGGLLDNSANFHLLNRGLTVTAFDTKYDARSQDLCLELANGYYGVLDGGHTYAVIRKNIAPYLVQPVETETEDKAPTKTLERPDFFDAFVRMEVVTGVKSDLLVDIARSRNTSAQVKDESLANLEGSFDWLKDILAKTPFGPQVAYKENEDDNIYPIDIREIVALLTLFHPTFQDTEKPPIMGYSSKGRCLELFRNEPEGYQSLRPIIPDILKLYDYIHLHFADLYKTIGGFGAVGDNKATKSVKLAKVTGVKGVKEGFPLFYLGQTAFFQFPDGWLLPVLSALRGITSYKTVSKWKVDPYKFFDRVGKGLVKATLESALSLGRNPNAVGKSRPHWIQLHERVLNSYMKMLNIDVEQEVKL